MLSHSAVGYSLLFFLQRRNQELEFRSTVVKQFYLQFYNPVHAFDLRTQMADTFCNLESRPPSHSNGHVLLSE